MPLFSFGFPFFHSAPQPSLGAPLPKQNFDLFGGIFFCSAVEACWGGVDGERVGSGSLSLHSCRAELGPFYVSHLNQKIVLQVWDDNSMRLATLAALPGPYGGHHTHGSSDKFAAATCYHAP